MSNADFWTSEPARQAWFSSPSPAASEISHDSSVTTTLDGLRNAIAVLIPLEASLGYLNALREPASLETRVRQIPKPDTSTAQHYIEELDEIDRQVLSGNERSIDLWQQIQTLQNGIRLKQRSVESLFWQLASAGIGDRVGLKHLVDGIRDRSLRQEAQMQWAEIERLSENLPSTALQDKSLDPFGDEGRATIGILLELEQRQRVVERLVLNDRTVPVAITVLSILYALGAVGAIALFLWLGSDRLAVEPLLDRKLSPLGIPWPVLVWSFFGSLAAIVYRFVHCPFRRLGETAKWMWMRPVQGVLLGGASYSIVEAVLSVLVDRIGVASPLPMADEVILVLSFLVGFSDRLAENVFRVMSGASGEGT
ncbi:MAG: hypothetical protein J7641_08220 [Cyanobacteria bacterium SID2]|nr:hypothetical protein [Cyanobacteria bacterium SID2]MBP0002932.1 hypothetical protein [Cyanobacteria bacterium SBC]